MKANCKAASARAWEMFDAAMREANTDRTATDSDGRDRQTGRQTDRTDGWTHGQTVTCQTFFWHFVIASRSDTCHQSDFASHLGAERAYPSTNWSPYPLSSSLPLSLSLVRTLHSWFIVRIYTTHIRNSHLLMNLFAYPIFPNDICTLTRLAVALLIWLFIIKVIKQYK